MPGFGQYVFPAVCPPMAAAAAPVTTIAVPASRREAQAVTTTRASGNKTITRRMRLRSVAPWVQFAA
jgi:hypothetical protein